jgi:CHAT domain-containing protein/tetratricopeptide (TPR) repeat protein
MNELPDAWGSPNYVLLVTACQRAEAHHQAYEQSRQLPELERAITGFSKVLDVAHNVDIRSAGANGLGTALWSRYERFGQPADLDNAIDLFREALAMYLDEETPATASFRANLGGVLRLRWRRSRSDEDLTESMTAIRAAVAATPQGHSRRSARLNNLADGLLALHVHHVDSSALTEAIQLYRQAISCAKPDSNDLAWARSNLAEALRMRYRSSGDRDRAVLDEAVEHARAALAATWPNHPLRSRFQSNLALIFLDRFHARGRPPDLAEATSLVEEAVIATPADHPNRAERLCILSAIRRMNLMHVCGLRTVDPRRPGDVLESALGNRMPARSTSWLGRRARRPRVERLALDQMIQAATNAAAAIPNEHILQADALIAQGAALAFKAVVDNDAGAFLASIVSYRQVALNPVAPTRARVTAGWQWAITELARTDGTDWSAGIEPFELAVNLLPHTAPRRVTHADRERQLAGFAGLACDAAACAIRLAEPERAVRLLEHGRGVLLSQALDSRTELTDLHEVHPTLARRFEEVRSALDRSEDVGFTVDPAAVIGGMSDLTLPGEDRHALAEEWERLLASIRCLPGFEQFLRPPRISELLSAASGYGPVVIVNVSGLRCDALLLAEGKVEILPLPQLNQAEVIQRVDEFRSAVGKAQNRQLSAEVQKAAQRKIQETMEWLWTTTTEPVLHALGLTQPSRESGDIEDSLPRLWWVPTGQLSALPLHAAGYHNSPRSCVLDTVISSYAPTLRSIATAWQANPRGSTHRADPPAPLVISVPAAPGVSDLPRVREETATLTGLLPQCRVLAEDQAVRLAVLDALPRHQWAHFACHAVSAADGAADSYLVLHDHATDPLTVADIARLRLNDAEIAYLSACETSVSSKDLGDEALHITGACHIAGFRHVIGTLWAVRDKLAQAVAADFYSVLTAAGADTSKAALALHTAVRNIRAAYPTAPELWASYVHVGP